MLSLSLSTYGLCIRLICSSYSSIKCSTILKQKQLNHSKDASEYRRIHKPVDFYISDDVMRIMSSEIILIKIEVLSENKRISHGT